MPSPCPLYFNRYTSLEILAENLRCKLETFSSPRQLKLHRIPKKKNQNTFREVWEVENLFFKDFLRTFNIEYLNFTHSSIEGFPLNCVHGFINKKSILTNARAHIGKSFLLKVDINDFFGSITSEALEKHFKEMDVNLEISKILSSMLTIDGKLPQGFCTSPLMSNLVFFPLDKQLLLLASKYDCAYTRYADDITFSSNKELPTYTEIQQILSQGGFELNKKKCLLRRRGQVFYVTGLSVSDSQPRVSKKWKRNLRQEIYFIQKNGLSEHVGKKNYSSTQSCINVLDGKIRFLKSIEPQLANKVRMNFTSILQKENREVIYPKNGKNKQKYFIYIDECIINEILCLCLVLVEDVDLIENSLRNLQENLRQRNFLPQKKGSLDKKTFHWSELSESIREKIIEVTRKLPFQAYISCKKFNRNYKKEYEKLFFELLNSQFIRLDGNHLDIFVETTNVISEQALQDISDALYEKLKNIGSRRPSSKPIVKMLKKHSHALSMPDFVLGVFNKYALLDKDKIKLNEYQLSESFFDSIKPKLKTICMYTENNQLLRFKNKNDFTTKGYELWPFFKKKKNTSSMFFTWKNRIHNFFYK